MNEVTQRFQQLLERFNIGPFPSGERILGSMDPVAWTLLGLLLGAIVLAVVLRVNSRRAYLEPDDVESTPDVLLARLKQDPARLLPSSIISRLGAEATLDLLRYGDQIRTKEWRYRWSGVREELLHAMSQQNAFGPTYALARYYRSDDPQEPDTLRIRRTALIHKLGQQQYLEPNADGEPAQLRVRAHRAEVEGGLGFDGEQIWLADGEPVDAPRGPLVEMEPIEFRTLQDAEVRLHIRRTPVVGGGFRLQMKKRRNMWIVTDEEVEWVS